jgi:hypothetical protein
MSEQGTARDFDFWIGEWDVFGPQGRQAGTNSITRVLDGQALAEHWHGAGGVEGHSLNAYDTSTGRWHQTWVDSTGGVLLLDGGLVDGAMVLEGTVAGMNGDADQRQRITWTQEPDGVRQHWETSDDDGTSWQTAFDGHYRPAS